jgi:hypothetical protein
MLYSLAFSSTKNGLCINCQVSSGIGANLCSDHAIQKSLFGLVGLVNNQISQTQPVVSTSSIPQSEHCGH